MAGTSKIPCRKRLIRATPRLALLFLVLGGAASSSASGALRPEVVIVRPQSKISGISFSRERIPLVIRELEGNQVRLQVRVTGTFKGKKKRLLLDSEPVALDSDQFDIEVTLREATTVLAFTTVDIFGQVETEEVTLRSEPADPVREILRNIQGQTTSWSLGVSGSLMSYEDNSGKSLQQYGLGAKASFSTLLSRNRRHMLAGNLYGTLLPISRSPSDLSLQLIGGNLRYGYYLGGSSKLKFWLFGGYFLTTTSSPDDQIGFKNQLGPQIYPMVSMQLGGRQSMSAYLKFAQLASLTDFSSHELAGGISYTRRPLLGLGSTYSFDYSSITLLADQAEIHLSSVVLGYSVNF